MSAWFARSTAARFGAAASAESRTASNERAFTLEAIDRRAKRSRRQRSIDARRRDLSIGGRYRRIVRANST